ncbi:hypothetical protein [Streptomyces silvensis]|uniref:Uncharacterized protein n=1 Tax=Streptomyces silvensis TaxID=1765722 RepID=A0A0W7X7U7_9ACTN|nr:hypothetical protein [Streptomyces silvensis]KUF18820.1 hypothetical protein AT728_07230 [Streptomyces silvensis]
MKVYQRTENGGTPTTISQADGLQEVNHAMMGGKRGVRTMSSITRTDYAIEYKDGRSVRLVLVDAPAPEEEAADVDDEPREWHGTASRFDRLHRFDETNRARCNRRIRANATPPIGGKGPWGVFKRTRSEIESSKYAHHYTFCPRCSALES